MDWDWAVGGVTDEVPRTTGPECINYMTNRRRWIEAVLFTIFFICVIRWTMKRMDPIVVPSAREIDKPHTAIRLILMLAMTFTFGIEMGFKLANRSVIFVMNPCHIQTVVQIYLLASKPSKTTIALFRIQMNNLNGPFLAFLFPEVECRTLPFEQAAYWMQHALLYIIPVYMLKSGAYKVEAVSDYSWVTIGVMIMLLYHFVVLNAFSIYTGINLNHMLCAAIADPFQGQNYRIAAVIHESILCPILNKMTVLIFSANTSDSCPNTSKTNANNSSCISNINLSHSNNSSINRISSKNICNTNEMPFDARLMVNVNRTDNYRHSCAVAAAALAAGAVPTAASMLYHQQNLSASSMEELSCDVVAETPTTMSLLRRRHTHAGTPSDGDVSLECQLDVLLQRETDTPPSSSSQLSSPPAATTMPIQIQTTKID